MAKRRRKRTRKWAPRWEGARGERLNFRAPARIHDLLDHAAQRTGWTISAEIVHRLSESFALPATPTHAVMALVGYAIDEISKSGRGKKTWLTDPTLFQEARRAAEAAFDLLAPPGEAVTAASRRDLGIPPGQATFLGWWDEVRRYDSKTPIDATKPQRAAHQRRLRWLREALGSLPDRIKLWEQTGREARRHFKTMAPLKEITDLLVERDKKGLSSQKLKNLQDLFSRAPEEVKQMLNPKDLSLPGPFHKMGLDKQIADLLVERDKKGLTPQRLKLLRDLYNQAPADVKQLFAGKMGLNKGEEPTS